MALTDEYEPVRASLLHQSPLPTLEDSLPRLKSEETRLELTQPKTDLAFAATDKQSNYCRHCHQTGHILPQCPTVSCHACKKIGHIASHCPGRRSRSASYKQRPQPSKPVFAAINESAATSSNTTALSDVESLLKKTFLSSGNTNTALSTTS
ncbi:hypothetical protein PIB30_113039, partial [Stylosanthes scabra]|nr:hypothetical protein [Stylosanthes scabra]